jgi:Protein of unknown function (DUF2510)
MYGTGSTSSPGWFPDPQVPGQMRYWDGAVWTANTSPAAAPVPVSGGPVAQSWVAESPDVTLIRRIATYERVSGWFWIALGVLQTLSLFLIIAGVWNIVAGVSRLKMAPRVERREASVPPSFEGLAMLIVVGIINFLFGAVIGLILVGVDLYVRDQILKNRHLFTSGPAQALSWQGSQQPYPQSYQGTPQQQVAPYQPGPYQASQQQAMPYQSPDPWL